MDSYEANKLPTTLDRPKTAVNGATLIINTHSRRGQQWHESAQQILRDSGVQIGWAPKLTKANTIEKLIQEALDRGSKLIVVGGGDGTIRCAAGALANTDATMGVLPLGTVNDFVRNLGIEPTLEAACKVIAEGNTAMVDLAQANDDYFIITGSIGLSALTQTVLSPQIKKLFGPLGYVISALLAWRKLNHLKIEISHDGNTEKMKVMQAGVINGHSWMGGKFEIPGVDLESGRMAFYAVPPQTVWDYFRIARHIRHGEFFSTPGLRAFTTCEVRIETRKPYPIVLDGDICGKTPVTFRIVPEALRVCVPAEFQG